MTPCQSESWYNTVNLLAAQFLLRFISSYVCLTRIKFCFGNGNWNFVLEKVAEGGFSFWP